MATAEIGALRVSLSMDSAAFTAGATRAASTARTTSTQISTSFQTASTRVAASMTAMTAAMRTQMSAGLMQQVGALRTGLLGLISPVGILVGGAAALLPQLIGRHDEAAEAARVHADMIERLNQEVMDARNQTPEYIQGLQDEAAASLDAAQAQVALARAMVAVKRARHEEALNDALAEGNPVGFALGAAFGIGTGGDVAGMNDELQEALDKLRESEDLVAAVEQQIVQLRAQSRRSWMIRTIGGGLPGDPPADDDDDTFGGLIPSVDKLTDAQRAILDKVRDFEARQTEIVRQAEEQRRALRETAVSSVASIFGSLAKIVGDGSERAFKVSKRFALAEAAINVGQGVTKALASAAPPVNFINAAAVAAAGAAQIAGILRTQPGSAAVTPVGGGGGSSAGGAAAGGGSSSPSGHVVNVTLAGGDSFTRQQVRDLIKMINGEVRDGAKIITLA